MPASLHHLAVIRSRLWWAYKVDQLGPPPKMPNFLLAEMDGSVLSAGEWWHILGGGHSRYNYGEIEYALRWLRLEKK